MPDKEKENSGPGNNIDLGKILLPKKEVPGATPDSAQRVHAGALMAQENRAAATGLTPKTPTPQATPPQSPTPLKLPEEPAVKPLQTYRSDIESLVEKGGVSQVSIAAAEAMRKDKKEEAPLEQKPAREAGWWKRWVYLGAGGVLALSALALIGSIFWQSAAVPVSTGSYTGLIFVDEITVVEAAPGRQQTMDALVKARDNVHVALGLIEQLTVVTPKNLSGAPQTEYSIVNLLSLFAPGIPEGILRTVEPEYVLGVHSYDRNQPFLILRVDSYDVAYRAMLEWERSMRADLIPLFNRQVSPTLAPTPILPTSTTTSATSTAPAATTTPVNTPEQPVILATPFVDRIVENRDTRAIVDAEDNLLLLWTFLNKQTILITTNEATLREIITRVAATPIQYQP